MEDSPLHFARPLWLYAGPVLCVLMAWLFIRFDRRRDTDLARLVHPRFRGRLMPGFSRMLRRVKRVLWVLAMLLLCVAAAGPRKGYEWREVKRRGIDILFAVDTSRSMLAEDLTPNRLERARMGIHDFVGRLEGDRVGLIPFAGSSYALCPLTLDYDAFRESLDALDTDLIPRQGTDVASAIREAERLFTEQGNNHRILVLITDGEDLQGDALEAATAAAKNGMAIYPVGVGSAEGATIPLRQPDGSKDFVRDNAGNPVRTKLDEATLRKIADVTGGLYAPLGRGAEGLDTIYREKLRLVPKEERDQRMEKVPLERFEWPLGAAILLLMMEFLLPDRRRETTARALPSAARRNPAPRKSAATVAASLLLAAFAEPARAAEPVDPKLLYNKGTAEYNAGDFKKAAESLRSSLNTPDLKLQNRSYYNLGNSLYRTGQASLTESPDETIKSWEEAIKAYGDALALNNGDEDARYNLELVKRKLEELKKKQQDQKEDDKDQKNKEEKKDDKKDEQKEDQQKKDQQTGGDTKEQQDQNKDGQKEGDQKDAKKQDAGQKGDEKKSDDPTGEKKPDGTGAEQKDKKEEAEDQKKQDAKAGKEGEKKDKEQPGADEKKDGQPQEAEPKDAGRDKDAKEASAQEAQEATDKNGEPAGISEERRKPGEMTPAEARQLLQTLRSDERTVIPLEKPARQGRFRNPNNTTKGKTW